MNEMMILQSADAISKSAEMAEKDPYGFIITAVAILVVFASLIILYFAYKLIGITVNKTVVSKNPETRTEENAVEEETAAAISMALHEYLGGATHDKESYIITIKRK